MKYDPLNGLAQDLDLARRQRSARLSGLESPAALVSSFHGINFAVGDAVYDTVTGSPGEVIGSGVAEVQTEGG
jgi:hypothetical protein